MRPFLPRPLPRARNYMRGFVQVVTAYARGGDRTRMPFSGQGILSPSSYPNRPRQRGLSNEVGCTEAHRECASSYHFRYHGPEHVLDRTPLKLLVCVKGLFCLTLLAGLAACENSRTINGHKQDCVGFNDQKDSTAVYEYSVRNIIVGIFFVEFIAPPVIVALKELECPKAVK